MSLHRSPRASAPRRSRRERGQAIAEFALVWPIFVVAVMALLEFGVAFNNLLTINYASRNAALIGAEAGNNQCADVVILSSIEKDVTAPAAPSRIASVSIYYSDDDGNQLADTGMSGADVWTRSGSTPCTFQGTTYTVPYTLTAANTGYPYWDRCNQINGCATLAICGAGQASTCHSRLDNIGVKITYNYTFITPLSSAISLLPGTGNFNGGAWTFVQSQQMRMEPIL